MNTELNFLLSKQPLLLFDGECGFCNKTVLFFLKHENKNLWLKENRKMHFISLQSEQASKLKKYFEIESKIESLILIKENEVHIKSCAALRLTLFMKMPWPLMMGFVIIPPFLRNIPYNLIAKYRMKIFGRVKNCELLKKEDQERFL